MTEALRRKVHARVGWFLAMFSFPCLSFFAKNKEKNILEALFNECQAASK